MKTKFILIFLVFLCGIGIFVAFKHGKKLQVSDNTPSVTENSDISTVSESAQTEVTNVDSNTNKFIHKGFGFSFEFPSTMISSDFDEGNGEEIIFQSKTTTDWFQIYITPWDEGDIITGERIKKDIPNMVIIDPQTVVIGPHQKEGVGPKALIFFSKEDGVGDTREIWFVHDGELYQITTYKNLDSMIGQVLGTLSFN